VLPQHGRGGKGLHRRYIAAARHDESALAVIAAGLSPERVFTTFARA